MSAAWQQEGEYDPAAEQQQAGGGPESPWGEGNYTGVYVRHEPFASAVQGTPGLRVFFQIGDREVAVEMYLTPATLGGMTGDQLEVLGWDGEYPEAGLNPPEAVGLWMKKDLYKNKWRDRWNVSTGGKEATPESLAAVARACQLWKARKSQPAPVPAGKPSVPKAPAKPAPAAATPPPRKAPAPAGGPPPRKAAPPAEPPADPKKAAYDAAVAAAHDSETAWAAWVAAGCEDGDAFWSHAATVGDDPDKFTKKQWQKVASGAPPF